MRSDFTPWARNQLSEPVQNQLAAAEPAAGRIHVGKGQYDWRALVTFNGHVLADVRGRSADAAAAAALAALGEAPMAV